MAFCRVPCGLIVPRSSPKTIMVIAIEGER